MLLHSTLITPAVFQSGLVHSPSFPFPLQVQVDFIFRSVREHLNHRQGHFFTRTRMRSRMRNADVWNVECGGGRRSSCASLSGFPHSARRHQKNESSSCGIAKQKITNPMKNPLDCQMQRLLLLQLNNSFDKRECLPSWVCFLYALRHFDYTFCTSSVSIGCSFRHLAGFNASIKIFFCFCT